MWLYICIGASLAGFLFSKTGRNLIKVGDVVFYTLKERLLSRRKDIKIMNINDKNILIHEDLILVTSKSHKNYDIVCFHSDSVNLIEKDIILSHDIEGETKNVIPTSLIKHGTYVSTIPFRPEDFNYTHLFVAIKNEDKTHHTVYKFNKSDYINFIDIIHKYEETLKAAPQKTVFAEAYD